MVNILLHFDNKFVVEKDIKKIVFFGYIPSNGREKIGFFNTVFNNLQKWVFFNYFRIICFTVPVCFERE
jgi:hypothetical protein